MRAGSELISRRLDSRSALGHLRAMASKPNDVYLIDGSGYIFRAFHALPPMTRGDGTPTNAV
jgi:hypothetical protein